MPLTHASNSALLTVKQLSISFDGDTGSRPIINNISFALYKGQTLALVGESGSGKSVTAHAILRLLSSHARFTSGEIFFDGVDLLKLPIKAMQAVRGSRIAMIFQEPMTSLNPLHTVGKQIAEMVSLHQPVTKQQAYQRALELLTLVELNNPEQRLKSYPHQLSGGQRQRVMIAMALANNPEILIADEPTTALDVTIAQKILELLLRLQEKLGMAILLISHDLNLVRRVTDYVCVMQQGALVEQGKTEQVFTSPQHPYTCLLLDAEPNGEPARTEVGNTLLECKNLKVWFPIKHGFLQRTVAHVKAVDGINIKLAQGQTLGVVGESGSGKSTLGLALLRLIESQGPIVFAGNALHCFTNKQLRPLRRQLQIVFQDPFGSLSPRMSVAEIIGEGLDVHNIGDKPQREQTIIQTLIEVGLDPETRHRYPHEFSGGQRQRISIARALVLKPQLIVLDEPTSALDRTVQKQVVELLRDLQVKYNLTYLFISHDLAVVKALCHQLIVMRDGKVVEAGCAKSIFSQPQDNYTKQLLAAAFLTQPMNELTCKEE